MRRFSFIIFILVIWLATCSGPKPKAPAPVSADSGTDRLAIATSLAPTSMERLAPGAKLPAAAFDARTYIDTRTGFALDYPIRWKVDEIAVGP